MRRIVFFVLSLLFVKVLFAQSDKGTNISGDDAGWGDGYDLIYKVDGIVYKAITLEEGAIITPEPAPVKEGYTFSGWSDIPVTMPASNVEVTGTFSINSYKLVYVVDGSEYKSLTLEYGSSITPETAPTKEGYTFSGWSEIPATMPASNVEVTGSFSVNSYKLVYIVDGTVYKTDTLAYGSVITPIDAPVKEGATFSGWSEIPSTMPARDVTITGLFETNTYSLTYMIDGEFYKSIPYEYGAEITPEVEPTKEGYTFSGWSEIPSTMPASNMEVTGTFSINSYTLVYKVDGVEYKSLTLEYGSSITPEAAPTKEGYTFSGWSEIPSTMPADNVEVTGSFSINSYKLIYVVDGVVYKTDSLTYGSVITPIDAPVKEGSTFSGWSEIPSTMPAGNVAVTGTFEINTYSLTYKIDGEFYKSLPYEYGAEITPEVEPTKEGYTFSGWSDIPATMPADNVDVTGSFTVNKYLLTVLVDDEVIYSDSIAYGTRLIDYLDLITKNGIDLTQWEWYSQIDTISMPAHDVIINAVRDAVSPIFMDTDSTTIFDLTGRKIQVDDVTNLPSGVYIRNGRKFIVR